MPLACVCHTVRLVAAGDATTEAGQTEQPGATEQQEAADQQEATQQQEATEQPQSTGNGAANSDNLLIEVDGKLVPNYDATMVSFKEGDVVSGKVVRIDQDEVLFYIGYKS